MLRHPIRRQLLRLASLTLIPVLVAISGCAGGRPAEPGGTASPTAVTNCGRQQAFDRPPQRIVSMNQHVTEILLRLGVGDRIVGIGYAEPSDGELLPDVAAQYRRLKGLAKEYPSAEQLLDADPELVVGGMRSAFDDKAGRSRETLEKAGIRTFLFTEYCTEKLSDVQTFAADFAQLGQILGVEDRAQALTRELTGRLDAVAGKLAAANARPVPVFFYDSGEKTPFTVGGTGIGNLIATLAGAKNIFPEIAKPFGDGSWEQVGERAPQAVVILDYGTTTADQKRQFLLTHPIAATTPAVRDKRIIVVTLRDFFEGPRMATAVERIAQALHPAAFA